MGAKLWPVQLLVYDLGHERKCFRCMGRYFFALSLFFNLGKTIEIKNMIAKPCSAWSYSAVRIILTTKKITIPIKRKLKGRANRISN